ncbi:MAG: CGNR zinc finger domain-containing protein [Actinophytocola sp.]|uniref:CGNR zinc finger domain-containing protein n=1 Tax=Actinophytocola sp. TaxID=1872138 RepID=UPI003D6C310D
MVDDEALLLALLNSAPVVDGVPVDELADDETARGWLTAHAKWSGRAPAAELREARTALRNVARGAEPPTSLAPLLDGVVQRPELTADGVEWRLGGDSVVVRAVLAWDALRAGAPGRLRPCANGECSLFLVDRSRANNARWCSMAVCGNRMKARRHYQRVRGA